MPLSVLLSVDRKADINDYVCNLLGRHVDPVGIQQLFILILLLCACSPLLFLQHQCIYYRYIDCEHQFIQIK